MLGEILKRKEDILRIMQSPTVFTKDLDSESLFQIVEAFANDPEIRPILEANKHAILTRCTQEFDMFNYYTILSLKKYGFDAEECNQVLDITVNKIFSIKSRIFLRRYYNKMQAEGIVSSGIIFEEMLAKLKQTDTSEASTILFDLYIFPDFQKFLNERHRVMSTLIEAYQIYAPEIMSSDMFAGSSIIGKMLKGNNEEIIENELRSLLEEKHISTRNVQMVGGGGNNLVYKIKDKVIKLGEERNNRKIYINHRILASLKRQLVKNDAGEDQFYVEIMKHVRTGDITEKERDELRKDLYDQGLVWTDDKLINCGLLDDDDENICTLPVDYVEVAGNINNPYRREAFMKRKRKVVVIDNDHITYNPLKSTN